jgi:hypothetical protein
MPTSVGHKPSSNNAKESNDRLLNIGACNTASAPLKINPTDEANAPLIYTATSANRVNQQCPSKASLNTEFPLFLRERSNQNAYTNTHRKAAFDSKGSIA